MRDQEVNHSEREVKKALEYVLSEPGRTYSFIRTSHEVDKAGEGYLSKEVIEVNSEQLTDWQMDILLGQCIVNAQIMEVDLQDLQYENLIKTVNELLEFTPEKK